MELSYQLVEILWRCHDDLTMLLRRVYQKAEPWRVICACSKCARCMAGGRSFGVTGVLHMKIPTGTIYMR